MAALRNEPLRTPPRCGLPFAQPYVYRAPRPAWATRAIAVAEAQHGAPGDGPDYDDTPLLADLLALGYARPVAGDQEAFAAGKVA
jgi:hypothetical protein